MSANVDAAAASAPGSNLSIAIRRGLTDGAGVVAILYVILFALYALWDPSALTVSGVTNLSNNAAPLALAAAGESLVVISKGFDLSVAGIVSLSNVLMATYPVDGPGGALVSLMICLGVGGAIGVLNGILVAVLRLQSIAATLGTMIMGQGLALVIMDAPGGTIADWVSYTLTDVLFGIIPISGLIVLAVVAFGLFSVAPTRAWAFLRSARTKRRLRCRGFRSCARASQPSSARACSMDSRASC